MSKGKILLYSFIILLFIGTGVLGGYFIAGLSELPRVEQLREYSPSLITKVYSAKGELLGEFFQEKRRVVSLSATPPYLQKAFIAAEDQRFYHHQGIDWKRILKAAWVDLITWSRAQGASTITQQLARNLFLTFQKTLVRKIKETVLAIQIERRYSKKEILAMYLNQIYFGEGIYGVAEASSFYFGKKVEDLNLAGSAFLAAIPRNPAYYSPLNHPQHTKLRAKLILEKMHEVGFITKEELVKEKERSVKIVENKRKRKGNIYHAPYFVEWVHRKVEKRYGYKNFWRGGLKIYTTLNLDLQKAAEEALVDYLKKNDHQGALLAMDPHTGFVKALVGGRDFEESQFNRATQARRQTGSAFKIFTYTAAIDEKQFTPVTPFFDGPIAFGKGTKVGKSGEILEGKEGWSPQNYEKHFWGKVYLWQMFAHSINVSSVRLLEKVGIKRAIDYAHLLGIQSKLNHDLTLTLGTSSLTLLEMVRGYATIANYGVKCKPIFVCKIEDSKGRVLEENFSQGETVLSPQTSYVMIDLLKKVIDYGTGRRVRWLDFNRPCGGKTGTVGWPNEENTDKTMDAWFIGFTPDLVAGVWIGNDDATPLGEKVTGSSAAIPVWVKFMKKALENKTIKDFPAPPEIVFKKIDTQTGLLATSKSKNALWFAFLEGTSPQDKSTSRNKGKIIEENYYSNYGSLF
ncbi:MAG: PBP1A family penicillin-binding protein [Candidatus Aerophobetes bacterium]|nr:PBP1A family penicillin-binding protein [Candidatus Aerophobetes bacterium]